MKIALINPQGSFLGKNPEFQKFFNDSSINFSGVRDYYFSMGPGLLILAALTPEKYEVEIIDENIQNINFTQDYDLVGITMMTQQAVRGYQIADRFRKIGVKVVIGGIHASILPHEAKMHADAVVVGEAEELWPLLLDDFEENRLQQIYTYNEIINIKQSPLPRYELLRHDYSCFNLQTSRGCPHDCEFCAASKMFGRKYRQKDLDQIIEEIKYVKEIHGNIRFFFGDDNLFVNKKFTRKFLEALIPLRITWRGVCDLTIYKEDDLLELLRKSGCKNLFIGFESAVKSSLQGIDRNNFKYNNFDIYPKVIQKIQSYGIGVMGGFIIGLDKDDKDVFDITTEFIVKNKLSNFFSFVLTPFPGTRLREKMKRENILLDTPWDNYTTYDANFIHPKLSKEELESGVLRIFRNVNSESNLMEKLIHFKSIYKKLEHTI